MAHKAPSPRVRARRGLGTANEAITGARAPPAPLPGPHRQTTTGDLLLIVGYPRLCREVGKSRVQVWRDIRAGTFPAPIEIGPNSVAWYRVEVNEWLASRRRRTYRPGPSA